MGSTKVSGVLLDTHALVWLSRGEQTVGPSSRRLADTALANGELTASAMTFWEVALLARAGRLELPYPPATWRQSRLASGLLEIPVAGDIGIAAVALEGLHRDPADRIIIATALVQGSTLVTADERILSWSGPLARQDARR